MCSAERVALVTGAGSGIGKQVALALMRGGFAVVLAGRRKEPLEATARAPAAKPLAMALGNKAGMRSSSSRP